MAKLEITLSGPTTWPNYFKDVKARLDEMGTSQNALARELDMDYAQMCRYFTGEDPNPTGKTIVAIEAALVTIKSARRK